MKRKKGEGKRKGRERKKRRRKKEGGVECMRARGSFDRGDGNRCGAKSWQRRGREVKRKGDRWYSRRF